MNNSATLNAISETSDLATFSNFALLVPATFANLLAIVIFFRSVRREGHVANLFLLCLSCTDLLGCFYGLHVVATPLYQHLFSPVICSILVFFGAFFGLLSALSATVLAIDRYFALCKPYTYGIAFTRKRAFLYIGIIVLIATSVCLINVVGLGSSHQFVNNSDGSQTIQCSSRLYQTAPERRVFGYLYGILGTAVLLVVTFCNVQVIITVLKMRRRVASLEGAGAVGQTNQVEVKFARVIIGLSIVLLVCWSPFMVSLNRIF
ncbi:rhodopsin, GQ-coupled-like [Liolophura sinensis]|uniref:rhodopsin, GQ-coupled-like n=1 Tax=Liolophura sinensis TaxID=3198878 RepID=UPI003158D56A